jgi:hypothetical protein
LKTLIDDIVAFLNAAITATDLSAKIVLKGWGGLAEDVPEARYPYVAVDDGGERVEDINNDTQNRIYTVVFEIASFAYDEQTALDEALDVTAEVKAEIEKEANRQLDGHIWGVTIIPFGSVDDNNNFFRGRRVAVDYMKLEDREYNPY